MSGLRVAAVMLLWAARLQSGVADCAPCHKAEVAHFAQSRMTSALEKASESAILKEHPKLAVTVGAFSFEIARSPQEAVYTVKDDRGTFRVPLAWAFGQGTAGQTYLFQREGNWYESRVSFFSALGGLDLTMGAQNIDPHGLPDGAGRPLSKAESVECFGCHATGAGTSMIAGIQCERCHGASDTHVKSMTGMKKLGALSTEEMSDLCGQCHRTWAQIAAGGPRGIQNVRFQPYRLANSKCYDAADSRIRCTACHDPHGALETSAATYDAKCLGCHAAKGSVRICPKSTKDCVTCHMPKLDLPGAHKKFTDHMIRIVKANEKYPD